jgi:hypothetical protein
MLNDCKSSEQTASSDFGLMVQRSVPYGRTGLSNDNGNFIEKPSKNFIVITYWFWNKAVKKNFSFFFQYSSLVDEVKSRVL